MNIDRAMTLDSSTIYRTDELASQLHENCQLNTERHVLILMVDDNPDLRHYVASILK